MRHRSIQVTVDIYGHSVPGGNRAAVDRLDDAPRTAPDVTSASPAATENNFAKPLSALDVVVNLNFASWNRIAVWLQRIEALRGAA
jgi:hypothetical protein